MQPADRLATFLTRLAEWVDEASWPVETTAYGDDADQVGELRLPEGPGPHPTAVVIHGGFWRAAYTHATTAAISVALARAGWATWNLEYRRVGSGGGYPETLEDVAAGTDALARLDAPLDLDRTVAIGHSAGGHLALWLASTGRVAGAVGLAAVSDLTAAASEHLGGDAAVEFLGGTPDDVPEAYGAADPALLLPFGVPQVLAHGTQDDRVPIAQSRSHIERARAAGDACRLLELEGVDHFDVIDPRSRAWSAIQDALTEMMAR